MNPEQKPTETPVQPTPVMPLAPVPAPMAEVTAAIPPPNPQLPTTPDSSAIPPSPNGLRSNKNLKLLTSLGAIIFVIALAVGLGLWFGDHNKQPTEHADIESASLPKEATVTAECVAGRGKQYILPKDIPMGPIYDVYQGKVIAIEYLVGQKELTEQSEMFANLVLPEGEYDHLAVMPMDPHAGLDEAHFHVIGYMIPASQAKKIICDSSSTHTDTMSEDQMH